MLERELYPDSYIFDCAILNEISERNKDIAIDKDENSYIAGTTALSCLTSEYKEKCKLIALKVVDYLAEHEPDLFRNQYKATIPTHEVIKRHEDNRTLIFKRNDGREIGILIKRYSHAVKHFRVKNAEAMLHMLLGIESIPPEYLDEYNNVMVNIENESRKAIYDRFNGFIKRIISYACLLTQNPTTPEYIIRSLVGNNDYYCVDVIGSGNNIRISGFNMSGTLRVKTTPYPSKLIEIQRGNYSTGSYKSNMMTLIFDGGWMVTMRIHSTSLSSTRGTISPSQLMYDISLKNLPYGMEDERISLF